MELPKHGSGMSVKSEQESVRYTGQTAGIKAHRVCDELTKEGMTNSLGAQRKSHRRCCFKSDFE